MSIDLHAQLQRAHELVSSESLMQLAQEIYSTEKKGTFSQVHATGRHVSAKVREWGAKARFFELPADGKTVLGGWKMPLSWDVMKAHVEVHDPFEERGRVLADLHKNAAHVIPWSGSTPNPIIGPVVKITTLADIEPLKEKLKGRIAYCPENPRPLKKRLMSVGVAAVVTSWSPNATLLPGAVHRFDGWADDPEIPGFHEGDGQLPAIAISPETGIELEVLMERGTVKLKLFIEAAFKPEDTVPVLCGYMDGDLQEEIALVTPILRMGGNDNASGVAVTLETLRVIQVASEKGLLPKPKRAVRALLVPPGYGLAGFVAKSQGILRRITAAVTWQSLGRHQETYEGRFRHIKDPDANASVADTLLELLLDAWLPKALPYAAISKGEPFVYAENSLSDPAINIPCPAVIGHDRFEGTSADGIEHLSAKSMHAFATISVAYVHFLATATAKEAHWLAQQTVRKYTTRIENIGGHFAIGLDADGVDKAALLALAQDRLTYERDIAEKAIMSAKTFMLREERAEGHRAMLKLMRHVRRTVDYQVRRLKELAEVEPGTLPALPDVVGLKELLDLRPYKTFHGTPSYDAIPLDARKSAGLPLAIGPQTPKGLLAALYWSTGKLTFAEIVRFVGYEFTCPENSAKGSALCTETLAKVVKHFKFMGEHGLVKWLQPGEAIPKPAKGETRVDLNAADEAAVAEVAPAEEAEPADEAPSETEAATA